MPIPATHSNPGSHEAVGVQPAGTGDDTLEPGSIAISVSAGYALGDVVLRPAKVMLVADAESD